MRRSGYTLITHKPDKESDAAALVRMTVWSQQAPANPITLEPRVPLRAWYYLHRLTLEELKAIRPVEAPNPNGKTEEEKKGYTEKDRKSVV